MHAFLIIIFMMVIGALIGGVTNVIAVRMLFHPFKTYYIYLKKYHSHQVLFLKDVVKLQIK